MANRPPRRHEGPPLSNSGRGHERKATKDTHGKPLEPKWVYEWDKAEKLGQGNFGVVYKVKKYDMSPLGNKPKVVAVKCVDKKRGTGISSTELTALSALATRKHPNIVAYFGKSVAVVGNASCDCFEFEYIDGGDVFHYMWGFFQAGYSIQTSTIQYFTRQILLGLQFIHNHGFAHRDIKPENIMLTKDWVVKITDFGLAQKMPQGYKYSNELAGTMIYLGPEAFADGIQGYAADIWAVGITVFNLYFKGNFPFQVVDRARIRKIATTLYPNLLREKKYDELREIEKGLVRDHYRNTKWPDAIDDWYETHKDGYDFIEKLLRVSHTRRPTVERCLAEPWIKAIEPKPQQEHEQARPVSPAEAAKNTKQTGLVKLQAAKKPKRKEGRKSKITKFLEKISKV